jgi:hypothetical protein
MAEILGFGWIAVFAVLPTITRFCPAVDAIKSLPAALWINPIVKLGGARRTAEFRIICFVPAVKAFHTVSYGNPEPSLI